MSLPEGMYALDHDSCGQADSGWWAFDIRTEIDYFVSDELIVYKSNNNMETFDIACGTVVDVLL
jgi:hypothetical protein